MPSFLILDRNSIAPQKADEDAKLGMALALAGGYSCVSPRHRMMNGHADPVFFFHPPAVGDLPCQRVRRTCSMSIVAPSSGLAHAGLPGPAVLCGADTCTDLLIFVFFHVRLGRIHLPQGSGRQGFFRGQGNSVFMSVLLRVLAIPFTRRSRYLHHPYILVDRSAFPASGCPEKDMSPHYILEWRAATSFSGTRCLWRCFFISGFHVITYISGRMAHACRFRDDIVYLLLLLLCICDATFTYAC